MRNQVDRINQTALPSRAGPSGLSRMNLPRYLALAFACSFAVTAGLQAQDAAAPIRRASPSPAVPAPTPMGIEEEPTPTPTPPPTPTPRPPEILRSSNGMPLPTPAYPRPTASATAPQRPATATPAIRLTPAPTIVRETPPPVIRETPEPVRETPPPTPASTPVPTATPTPEAKPTPEETPAPKEKPTPEPEATPLPTATPEPTATPQPTPKATPTPTATPAVSATPAQLVATPTPREEEEPIRTPTVEPTAKSPRILQEKPVRAAEPRPTDFALPKASDQSDNVGASRPTFDLSNRPDRDVASTIKRLENKWQTAIREHDVKALSELLAPEFVGTSSTGKVGSRHTLISALRRDKNTYTTVEARGMSVRTPGDDIAIVTGVTREAGMTPEGKRFKSSRRFTDTWVKRDGKWRCVASQTTDL